jgi:tetraacyldisaccharide 4'-kinase
LSPRGIPLLLAPLELVYASLTRARNARLDRTAPQRLRWPVVSIGNLSVGGAGKTPLVICLARLLAGQGFLPDVLSRGYGRSQSGVMRVDRAGSAAEFGDEPLLIARATGVPVYVGASRYQAGLLAEREADQETEQAAYQQADEGRHVHLLDDGFQHRSLARAADIVVFHRSDLHQRLLPAGRLREPLTSLKRADVIVLRAEDAALESAVRAYTKRGCAFWRVRRVLTLLHSPQRAMAFCAIARPAEFFDGLLAAGVATVERKRFRDHHRYTLTDIERLAAAGKRAGCDGFVVTAKDAVKLSTAMRQRLEAVGPLVTAELTVQLEDESSVIRELSSLLRI